MSASKICLKAFVSFSHSSNSLFTQPRSSTIVLDYCADALGAAAAARGDKLQQARSLIVRAVIMGHAAVPDALKQAADIAERMLKAKPSNVYAVAEVGALAQALMASICAGQAVAGGAER